VVLRPRLPTQADCAKLALELVAMLREGSGVSHREPPTAKGFKTAKPKSVASPAHAL
jgi:hypothetical protein